MRQPDFLLSDGRKIKSLPIRTRNIQPLGGKRVQLRNAEHVQYGAEIFFRVVILRGWAAFVNSAACCDKNGFSGMAQSNISLFGAVKCKTRYADVLQIGVNGRGKCSFPKRRGKNDHVRIAKLTGRGKHRPVPVTDGGIAAAQCVLKHGIKAKSI